MYLCYIEYEDGSGFSSDSMLLFHTKLEGEFWKKIIKKTYRDDITVIREINPEPKFAIKERP